MVSNFAGYVASLNIPKFLRSPLYGQFASTYGVNLEEIEDPLDSFPTFIDFFTRKIKPRDVEMEENTLVSPADSRVLSFCEVKGNDVLMIKDQNYKLGELLMGDPNAVFDEETLYMFKKGQKDSKNSVYSVIFYLSPGDYHRYHSPVDFKVASRIHIAGHLYPVKIDYIEKNAV